MEHKNIKIKCTSDIGALKNTWETLEKNAHCTPYQQYRWVNAFIETITPYSKKTHHFVTLHEEDRVIAILPFSLHKGLSSNTLSWIGNDHFNYSGGIYEKPFLEQLKPQSFLALWSRIKESLPSFDLLSLKAQLQYAEEALSPFAWINSSPSANLSHQLIYPHHNWSELLTSLRGKKTRKRMRNEENRLSREGDFTWKELSTDTDINRYLPELFEQRERRLRLLGIQVNETKEEYLQWYRTMLLSSLNDPSNPTRMIIVKLDDVLLAAIVLFEWNDVYYPLINSMTDTHYQTWSPGEYLLRVMMIQGCEEKIKYLDYGPGEDVYKTSWCNHTTPLFDTFAAETTKGKLVASITHKKEQAKRKIKHSPKLWEFYRGLRKLRSKAIKK